MKIKINPLAEGISENEKKYILLLEFCEGFQKGVAASRKKLGIPADQRNQDGIILYRADQLPDFAKLQEESYKLVDELKLPVTLAYAIESIIQWDEVMGNTQPFTVLHIGTQLNRKWLYDPQFRSPPSRLEVKARGQGVMDNWYESNRVKLSKRSIEPAYPLLQINKPLTKSEFLAAIETNWEAIQEAMEHFKNSVPYNMAIDLISPEELKISAEIYRCKKESPKMTYEHIYNKLHDERGITFTDPFNEVKSKCYDFRKLLRSIGFVKKKK